MNVMKDRIFVHLFIQEPADVPNKLKRNTVDTTTLAWLL